MSKPKHTPGLWRILDTFRNPDKFEAKDQLLIVPESSGLRIAKVNYRQSSFKADMANARLIAAAPFLLEACKYALKELARLDTDSRDPLDTLKLEAAIAKATGGAE